MTEPGFGRLEREAATRLLELALAEDGVECLRAVRAERPDALVVDVRMPGISGLDVIAALRADPATRALPIVPLSIVQFDDARAAALGVERRRQRAKLKPKPS